MFAALASSLLLLVSPLTAQAEVEATPVKTLTTHWTDTWPEKGFGLGLTSPVPLPTKRIDYQLHSAQLVPTAVSVPVSFASDHLPVAATYSFS